MAYLKRTGEQLPGRRSMLPITTFFYPLKSVLRKETNEVRGKQTYEYIKYNNNTDEADTTGGITSPSQSRGTTLGVSNAGRLIADIWS